jgi:hypothetical protein
MCYGFFDFSHPLFVNPHVTIACTRGGPKVDEFLLGVDKEFHIVCESEYFAFKRVVQVGVGFFLQMGIGQAFDHTLYNLYNFFETQLEWNGGHFFTLLLCLCGNTVRAFRARFELIIHFIHSKKLSFKKHVLGPGQLLYWTSSI